MRLLQIHSRNFGFRITKPALRGYIDEPSDNKEVHVENALVIFVSIEKHDSEKHLNQATESIIEHALKVGSKNIVIYPFAHLSPNLAEPSKAKILLSALSDLLKEEVGKRSLELKIFKAPFGWYKEFYMKTYGHPLSELSRYITDKEYDGSKYIYKQQYGVKKEDAHYIIVDEDDDILEESVIKEYFERFGIVIDEENIKIKWPLNITVSHIIEELLNCNKDFKNDLVLLFEKIFYKNYISKLDLKFSDISLNISKDYLNLLNETFKEKMKIIEEGDFVRIFLVSSFLNLLKNEVAKIGEGRVPIFPLGWAPIQAYIAVQTSNSKELVGSIVKVLRKNGIRRIIVDESNRRLGLKIREAGRLWANFLIIIGPKEVATGSVTVRMRRESMQISVNASELDKFFSTSILKEEFVCK